MLERINEFSKVIGYKINTQISIFIQYIDMNNCYNSILISNLRKTIPFARASKIILKNVFNQEVLDSQSTNYRIFLRDTKKRP